MCRPWAWIPHREWGQEDFQLVKLREMQKLPDTNAFTCQRNTLESLAWCLAAMRLP